MIHLRRGRVPIFAVLLMLLILTACMPDPGIPNGYIPNELVVIGDPTHIPQVLAAVLDDNLDSEEIATLDFANLAPAQQGEPGVSILVYRIIGEELPVGEPQEQDPLLALVRDFNTEADNRGIFARAEPNLIFSNFPRMATVDTKFAPSCAITGSGGSSGINGGPAGKPIVLSSTTPITSQISIFADQKAFANSGHRDRGYVDAPSSPVPRRVAASDLNLLIVDSSPWPSGSHYGGRLQIESNLALPALPLAGDSHGLFAASLASAMAEEERIYLRQVLRAYWPNPGRVSGNLKDLLQALHDYDNTIKLGTMKKTHTIVNMSFTFDLHPECAAEYVDSIRKSNPAIQQWLRNRFNLSLDELFAVDLPVVSLLFLFEALERSGYVFVAAAGNDGLEKPLTPAEYANVIGVEALSYASSRACFSNRGNISAIGGGTTDPPPGDNDPNTLLDDSSRITHLDTMCNFAAIDSTCLADHYCVEAIKGHMVDSGNRETIGGWTGTSFAAPLVSGLAYSVAAYGHKQEDDNGQIYDLSPAEVRSAVYCTATGSWHDPNPPAWEDSVGEILLDRVEGCADLVVSDRARP